MSKELFRAMRPLLIVFIILTAFFFFGRNWLIEQGIDHEVLLLGHLVIFVATIAALLILLKGGNSSNPNSFVRSMYGSVMIRFFLILVAAFIYIMIAKKNVNKPVLVICAVLYFLYSFIEITVLLKILKIKKNA